MDCISIENMEVFGKHGVFEEEAFLGQKFVISVKLYFDTRQAGMSDDLTKSLDYGKVCQSVKHFVETERFQLIESLAEMLAHHLLLKYDIIRELEITVKKPWAPVQVHLDTVAITIHRGWHKAYLSIGSNMGDREGFLDFAIDQLNALDDTKVTAASDYIETEPYGDVEQDMFLNGALEIETLKTPMELLDVIHEIEKGAHRERLVHWGPRTLDIDILFYDDLVVNEEHLHIPHVEIPKREFVLDPLSTIAPHYIHPVMRKTVLQLLEELA